MYVEIYNEKLIKKMSQEFKIPESTIEESLDRNMEDWKPVVFNVLLRTMLCEEDELVNLNKTFTATEKKVMIASVNSMSINSDSIQIGMLEASLEDMIIYEPCTIQMFLEEKDDLEEFMMALIKKVKPLSLFQRYVLLDYLKGFWVKDRKSLDEYAQTQ